MYVDLCMIGIAADSNRKVSGSGRLRRPAARYWSAAFMYMRMLIAYVQIVICHVAQSRCCVILIEQTDQDQVAAECSINEMS
jgi:hypothetical protein